jgi:hypothetical protein
MSEQKISDEAAAERRERLKKLPLYQQKWQRSESLDPIANVLNAAGTIRDEERLKGIVAFDEMARIPMVMRPIPTDSIDIQADTYPRPLRELTLRPCKSICSG